MQVCRLKDSGMFDKEGKCRTTLCSKLLAELSKIRRTIRLDYILEGQLIELASSGVIFDIQNL